MTKDEVIAKAWSFGAGGMTPPELAYLYDACCARDVLELGSMIGQSSYVIGSVAKSLTCVDAWIDRCPFLEGRQAREYKIDGMEEAFDRNMAGIEFTKVKAFTSKASRILGEQQFDVILVDADHSLLGVLNDIHRYRRKLRPGGLLMLHDYESLLWTGVRKAARIKLGRARPKIVGALGVFRL